MMMMTGQEMPFSGDSCPTLLLSQKDGTDIDTFSDSDSVTEEEEIDLLFFFSLKVSWWENVCNEGLFQML